MSSVPNESILFPNGFVNETSPSSPNNVQDISIDSRKSDPLNVDSPTRSHTNTKETKFQKNSLVFAKLSGHSDPPWPARVAKVCWTNGTHTGYEVFFYGTYQVGIVLTEKIWAYNEENIAKFSKPKMSVRRRVDFSKGLVEIRDCPDMAPSRDVLESASQIAKKLINRTAIKDDAKCRTKRKESMPMATSTSQRKNSNNSGMNWKPSSAMTGIKKFGDKPKSKVSSWVLAASNKKFVNYESTDDDDDEGRSRKKKRTPSMNELNDDSSSSDNESNNNNNNRRSNRNRKVPYWRRVNIEEDGSQLKLQSPKNPGKDIKTSAKSSAQTISPGVQNTRKSLTNDPRNNIKVVKNVEEGRKVIKPSGVSTRNNMKRLDAMNDSTGSEEALQNSNPTVYATRSNINKTTSRADCLFVKEEPLSENPLDWSVEQTFTSITRTDPSITPEDIKAIREQKIDGSALLKLNFDNFVTHCQVKVGPAIKLSSLVEKLKEKVLAVSNASNMSCS